MRERLFNSPIDPYAGAAIHDFDGVVVDTREFNMVFFPKLFKALELEIPSKVEIMGCFHMTLRQTLETLSSITDPAQIDAMVKVAHDLDRPIEEINFPHNQEKTLEELISMDLRPVIATNAEYINVEEAYKRKPHLREYFWGAISIEDVMHTDDRGVVTINAKPHKEPLVKAATVARVLPENSYMIGDSDTDMQAAHNAGIPGVHLLFLDGAEQHKYASASIRRYAEAPIAIRGLVRARAGQTR